MATKPPGQSSGTAYQSTPAAQPVGGAAPQASPITPIAPTPSNSSNVPQGVGAEGAAIQLRPSVNQSAAAPPLPTTPSLGDQNKAVNNAIQNSQLASGEIAVDVQGVIHHSKDEEGL